jgi:Fur family zinc uptake transcriptional regulator/Fur family ferric uptake transcriptional regulator
MEQGLSMLRKKGYKITPQRRAVIAALDICGQFPTVQQLLESVKKMMPDVSLDTIYRNLTLLTELGIVHEIHRHNGNVYEMVIPGHHHHHLICTQCGRTECVNICPMSVMLIQRKRQSGAF